MSNRALHTISLLIVGITTVSATDILLPSLPSLTGYFGETPDTIQLAIPVYLMGSIIGAPVMGLLSDHFGRKEVMLGGIILFLVGTLLCVYSPTFSFFLTARFIQGLGAIASPVVGWAILQDMYPLDQSAKVIAWMGSIVSLAPIFAPAVGGYIHATIGWQGNFYLIAILALITLTFMATLKPIPHQRKDESLSLSGFLRVYSKIIQDKPFMVYISFYAILNCGLWCYLTIIPFYFETTLGISPSIFGFYISAGAAFYILGTFVTPFILKHWTVHKVIGMGILCSLCGSGLFLLTWAFAPGMPLLIIFDLGMYLFGAGVIWGPSTSRALQRFDDIRGSASGARILIVIGSFAIGGFAGSLLNDFTLFPLAVFLVAMSVLCAFLFKSLLSYKLT